MEKIQLFFFFNPFVKISDMLHLSKIAWTWMSTFPSMSNANEVRRRDEGIPWCDAYFMEVLDFFLSI